MHVSLHGNDYADLKNFSEKCKSPRMWKNLCYVFHVGSQEYLMSKETKTSFKKFRKFQKSEEIVEVFVMFNSNEVLNQYITMKKFNQKTVGLKSRNQDINLNSVEFEEEVKICPLCGKPYKSWRNNPYPLEMDMVCDECNMNVIIPLRFGIDIKSIQKSEDI